MPAMGDAETHADVDIAERQPVPVQFVPSTIRDVLLSGWLTDGARTVAPICTCC